MPLYLCASPNRSIALDAKRDISRAITDVHCELTGAPRQFVHVFFFEQEQVQALGGLPLEQAGTAPYVLFGNIRSGRSDKIKEALVGGMRQRVAEILASALSEVQMLTRDIEAKWVMEGGDLLPEPGEEAEWLLKHRGSSRTDVA
ncbi:MAG: tautomerase family protein [Pseudomonadota bacterium]